MFWYVSPPLTKIQYHMKGCSLSPSRFTFDPNLKLTPGIQRGSMPKEVATVDVHSRFLKLVCCTSLLLLKQTLRLHCSSFSAGHPLMGTPVPPQAKVTV